MNSPFMSSKGGGGPGLRDEPRGGASSSAHATELPASVLEPLRARDDDVNANISATTNPFVHYEEGHGGSSSLPAPAPCEASTAFASSSDIDCETGRQINNAVSSVLYPEGLPLFLGLLRPTTTFGVCRSTLSRGMDFIAHFVAVTTLICFLLFLFIIKWMQKLCLPIVSHWDYRLTLGIGALMTLLAIFSWRSAANFDLKRSKVFMFLLGWRLQSFSLLVLLMALAIALKPQLHAHVAGSVRACMLQASSRELPVSFPSSPAPPPPSGTIPVSPASNPSDGKNATVQPAQRLAVDTPETRDAPAPAATANNAFSEQPAAAAREGEGGAPQAVHTPGGVPGGAPGGAPGEAPGGAPGGAVGGPPAGAPGGTQEDNFLPSTSEMRGAADLNTAQPAAANSISSSSDSSNSSSTPIASGPAAAPPASPGAAAVDDGNKSLQDIPAASAPNVSEHPPLPAASPPAASASQAAPQGQEAAAAAAAAGAAAAGAASENKSAAALPSSVGAAGNAGVKGTEELAAAAAAELAANQKELKERAERQEREKKQLLLVQMAQRAAVRETNTIVLLLLVLASVSLLIELYLLYACWSFKVWMERGYESVVVAGAPPFSTLDAGTGWLAYAVRMPQTVQMETYGFDARGCGRLPVLVQTTDSSDCVAPLGTHMAGRW